MVDFVHDLTMQDESLSDGIPQVYINDAWGTVCNMGQADADAFCRQLSFTNALSVRKDLGQ
jgi:hypothetical protein